MQSKNVPLSIHVTDEGMATAVRLEHSLKALDPIYVTDEGMSTAVRLEQPEKASEPILVTDWIFTFVRLEQPLYLQLVV